MVSGWSQAGDLRFEESHSPHLPRNSFLHERLQEGRETHQEQSHKGENVITKHTGGQPHAQNHLISLKITDLQIPTAWIECRSLRLPNNSHGLWQQPTLSRIIAQQILPLQQHLHQGLQRGQLQIQWPQHQQTSVRCPQQPQRDVMRFIQSFYQYSIIDQPNQHFMLSFSQPNILLQFKPNTHLTSALSLSNPSQHIIYFKFKVTRPKYYLVREDKGIIKPSQSKNIHITLHKDGISQAIDDKLKCFYIVLNHQTDKIQGFQDKLSTKKQRMPIIIENLPLEFDRGVRKNSSVKSITNNSPSKFMRRRKSPIKTEPNQIINAMLGRNSTAPKELPQPKDNIVSLAILGIIIGIISSLWI